MPDSIQHVNLTRINRMEANQHYEKNINPVNNPASQNQEI